MMSKSKIILLALTLGFVFFVAACDDQAQAPKKSAPTVVSGKIVQPVNQNQAKKDEINKKKDSRPKEKFSTGSAQQTSKQKPKQRIEVKSELKSRHYNSKGKIDPFKPLIQEKTIAENRSATDNKPKRILTPLEKIELGQIRLVAVVVMGKNRIAMVEEASGKGYEVGIGTYIGRNQGRVSEIKDSSIVIKEIVKDYKGRLKEHVWEMKLHKIDNEE